MATYLLYLIGVAFNIAGRLFRLEKTIEVELELLAWQLIVALTAFSRFNTIPAMYLT